MTNDADTCRKFVVPKVQSAGWDNDPHSIAEQRSGRSNYYVNTDLVRLFFDVSEGR